MVCSQTIQAVPHQHLAFFRIKGGATNREQVYVDTGVDRIREKQILLITVEAHIPAEDVQQIPEFGSLCKRRSNFRLGKLGHFPDRLKNLLVVISHAGHTDIDLSKQTACRFLKLVGDMLTFAPSDLEAFLEKLQPFLLRGSLLQI